MSEDTLEAGDIRIYDKGKTNSCPYLIYRSTLSEETGLKAMWLRGMHTERTPEPSLEHKYMGKIRKELFNLGEDVIKIYKKEKYGDS